VELTKLFEGTTAAIERFIGDRAFRPVRAVNAAVIDSVMTGIARRLATGPIQKPEQLSDHYNALVKTREYMDAVLSGTSQEANVKTRLDLATKEFASVK
jgi:hypothetical protein